MSEYESIAQRYIDSWNEKDAGKRRALIDELYTADVVFTDPLVDLVGTDALDGMVAGAQEQFAGLEFGLGPVDGHHDIARFTWTLGAPGADEPIVVGFDVITLVDGRIGRVQGFLDKVPG
ncbi:nuclear transport factor 2 family protein [Nocardia huaxiensis]|uniref:Nuclear transport factor 2 family protein n=1 Tax=Nocardia huaxiensis TaxID=2755382 RepID=A0A7D6VB02_9NOCA|nr:nuclear transport factor 2 family protein [Nocardia huaxiensis]QLY27875.1 nuclear transport factor 2 family protein [Nocardia huaxiensis]UFS98725.1 nuclear transport factor 2 family protein [Nocardia huaxiensis]